MKTQEMSKALRAFAELAEDVDAKELRRFASVFDTGKNESVSARIKRALSRWPAQQAHPTGLRKSLVVIASGLSACGANKQAADIQTILTLFDGRGTASVEGFVEAIATALTPPPVKPSQTSNRGQSLDDALARELADELTNAVLDPGAFASVIERLRNSKLISTPTLAAVANQYLGNSKRYARRKAAIEDILKRQMLDVRSHARGKALDRIGV